MKKDVNSKLTLFAKRTLAAFSSTLFELLAEKPFEKITINEICTRAQYPRATFYNYFDDIYDLMNYCWSTISQKDILKDLKDIPENERSYALLDRTYAFVDEHPDVISKIVKHNPLDGLMMQSLRSYMLKETKTILAASPHLPSPDGIPTDMVAEFYRNTMVLIIEWFFLRPDHLSKEEARHCVDVLLKPLVTLKSNDKKED